jgi:hypothetical protein
MVHHVPMQAAATATASDHCSYFTLNAILLSRKDNLKVSLPDIDDHFIKAVFAYLKLYEQDLAWSFISNSFFFSGGILYVVLSFWDYCVADVKHYYSLDSFAPLVSYVLNSVADLHWAYHAKQRNKKKRNMLLQWAESRDSDPPYCVSSKYAQTLCSPANHSCGLDLWYSSLLWSYSHTVGCEQMRSSLSTCIYCRCRYFHQLFLVLPG